MAAGRQYLRISDTVLKVRGALLSGISQVSASFVISR